MIKDIKGLNSYEYDLLEDFVENYDQPIKQKEIEPIKTKSSWRPNISNRYIYRAHNVENMKIGSIIHKDYSPIRHLYSFTKSKDISIRITNDLSYIDKNHRKCILELDMFKYHINAIDLEEFTSHWVDEEEEILIFCDAFMIHRIKEVIQTKKNNYIYILEVVPIYNQKIINKLKENKGEKKSWEQLMQTCCVNT